MTTTNKECDTYRKILCANIDPFLPEDEKIAQKNLIAKLDHQKLEQAVRDLPKKIFYKSC